MLSTNLGRAHDKNWPPRFDDGLSGPRSGLNLLDLRQRPFHGTAKILVDIIEILNNTNLITISAVTRKIR